MSNAERTYIMVKVYTLPHFQSLSSTYLHLARRRPAWARRQDYYQIRRAWLQAYCLEACTRN